MVLVFILVDERVLTGMLGGVVLFVGEVNSRVLPVRKWLCYGREQCKARLQNHLCNRETITVFIFAPCLQTYATLC